MLLNNELDVFKTLIIDAARHLEIQEEYVEKDYWLVLLLKHIFSRDYGYVYHYWRCRCTRCFSACYI